MAYALPAPLLRCATIVCLLLACNAGMAQNAAIHMAEGEALLDAGKGSKAMEEFDKAVQLENSARTYAARARAAYSLGKMDRFLLDVEQALKLDSTHTVANYQRALYAQQGKDWEGAESYSTRAIAHTKDVRLGAKAHLVRGMARAELKYNAAAIEDLEIAMASITDDIESLKTLAQLYDTEGRYEDALRVIERLCELEPDDLGHWTNRAFELAQLERYEDAMIMVQRSLLMDKDEPVALSNRAYINMKMGRDTEALSDIERSLRNFPDNPYALRTRAMLRLKSGDRDKACSDLGLAQLLGSLPEVDKLMQEHCADSSTPKKNKK
ncbi:MAG: tetratricopeptide repeat protein [Flavobacteriales bacterium]